MQMVGKAMFGNRLRTQIKNISKEITRVYLELDRTRRDSLQEGYVLNQWNVYWSRALTEEWLRLNAKLCELDDESERVAAKYSRAAFLLALNRLDEAARLYEELVGIRPSAAIFKGLAVVHARKGAIEEAKQFAELANAAPHGAVFKTTEKEILEEAEIGCRFVRDASRG
jgi:tetratricopeptide (TPR) repeat protein